MYTLEITHLSFSPSRGLRTKTSIETVFHTEAIGNVIQTKIYELTKKGEKVQGINLYGSPERVTDTQE